MSDLSDLTVVVPTRNAEALLDGCLESIVAAGPAEIIVVDGLSTDRTRELAARYTSHILSDDGAGLPAARSLGARAAKTKWIALVDVDVVIPPGVLEGLFREFLDGGYDALQAGQHSTSGPGYWGRALADHHRTGRSKHWFGLVATVADRALVVDEGFDPRFQSGEDIEFRWRLRDRGFKTGVSTRHIVEHRFAEDTFDFARDQFVADGRGLGMMIRQRPIGGLRLLALPAAAAARGIVLALARLQPQWVPYYFAYAGYNYVSIATAVLRGRSGARDPASVRSE